MKKTLLILTAAAGMLLLGGVSAKADEGTTLTLKASEGTFYSATGSASYYSQWTSSTNPVITILDGTNNSNMNPTNTDDFELHEGTSNLTHDYTVSVADGYVITGMTVTVTTTVDDMSVTVGTVSQTLTANVSATYTVSDLWRQTVGITITSTNTGNEGATFSNWTVTVQKDVDLSKVQVASISTALGTMPEEDKWYLLKQERNAETPAYDKGEGETMYRASTDDVVNEGDYGTDVAQYLLRFYKTDKTSSAANTETTNGVYNMMWATGRYWTSDLKTTSTASNADDYNFYFINANGNTKYFAINLYDMGSRVDNNGNGSTLAFWDSNEVTTANGGNNNWTIYEVTFTQVPEDEATEHEHEVALEALIEEAQAAYDANDGGYNTDIDFGFSSGDGVGNGIIQSTDQFSSPYTEQNEGSLSNLLDNDASSFWHSAWSGGSVADGVHYIEVNLSETYLSGDNAFKGGPLLVNILRRSEANNDHVTKMKVTSAATASTENADTTWIADIDLPYGSAGERVVAGFTCPADVYTLRFYEEETAGATAYNEGFFHLADFQLFYTTYVESRNEGLDEAKALVEAIATAQATLDAALGEEGTVSESDIAALQVALAAYNAYFDAIAELNNELLEAIELAYDAYEANCGYVTEEKEVTTDNPTADGLITNASQLSSPYTETTEGQYVASLIDGDPTTYWHSNWSDGAVAADKHYLQVELPDSFVVSGDPVTVRIQRRKGAASDQITKMAVKCVYFDDDAPDETIKAANSGTEFEIKTLSFPYDANYDNYEDNSVGEVLYENFTCPAGVKWLRFHEEETEHDTNVSGSASGRGYWHLAEFQLYATSLTSDCGNTTLKKTGDKDATFLSAIQTAASSYGNCTEEDITTLKEAISTYLNENISWTLGAEYGTLILPFNDDVDMVSGLTVYPCTGVSDDVVELGSAVNAIAPKTPYIVSGTANETPITFSGEASFKTSLYSDTKGLLTGTLTGTTAPTNSYVLQQHDGDEVPAFYLVDGSSTITVGNYHAYLTLKDESDGSVKTAVINFPGSGVATSIEAVETAPLAGSEAIYDLSGRKVTNPRSGIYIKGGKKVIIK